MSDSGGSGGGEGLPPPCGVNRCLREITGDGKKLLK